MSWRAWHVFIADHRLTDRFLLETVAREASDLLEASAISNWFFIRYWENGPHLRFRVRDMLPDAFLALGDRLRHAAQDLTKSVSDGSGRFAPSMRFDGWHADPSALPWFEQGAVHEILYEPEYRRYGGVQGLAVGEALFNLSSRVALKALAATGDVWSKREALALRLTVATIVAMVADPTDRREFLLKMASAWRAFAPDPKAAEDAALRDYAGAADGLKRLATSMLGANAGSADEPPLIQGYIRGVAQARSRLVALADGGDLVSPLTGIAPRDAAELRVALMSIAMSHVHMANNRLGMTPLHEYRFAQMLLWAADESSGETAGPSSAAMPATS